MKKLIVKKQNQLIGLLVGFSIIVNGKKYGKVYNNSPLIIEGDWKQIDIEAKQLWAKAKLRIMKPDNVENIEVSYYLKETYLLLYGFVLFLLFVLFLIFKLRIFNYLSLIILGLLTYQLSKITIKQVNR